MDMIRITILEENIDDNLWPEIIFAITQVKNVRPIYALEGSNSYQALSSKSLDVNYLQILGSNVYIFIYKKK